MITTLSAVIAIPIVECSTSTRTNRARIELTVT